MADENFGVDGSIAVDQKCPSVEPALLGLGDPCYAA
jgi:hypothetical protein